MKAMIDYDKAVGYLSSIGMVGPKNSKNVSRLVKAMDVQMERGAYKQLNRYTGKESDGLVDRISWEACCPRNMVSRFLMKMLERFKEVYDPNQPKFASICTKRTLDVITPLQFLYLITMDYADNYA